MPFYITKIFNILQLTFLFYYNVIPLLYPYSTKPLKLRNSFCLFLKKYNL